MGGRAYQIRKVKVKTTDITLFGIGIKKLKTASLTFQGDYEGPEFS